MSGSTRSRPFYGYTIVAQEAPPPRVFHTRSEDYGDSYLKVPWVVGGANSNNMYTTDPDKMFDPVITAMTNQTLVSVKKI